MADRFWVGGVGTWSNTARWSTTSGGTGGATAPGSGDVAIFDANSGGKFLSTVDVGYAGTVGAISITPSSGAGVLQIGIANSLTVAGNLTTTGTAGNNRILFKGSTFGLKANLTINGTVSISDCDFSDLFVGGTSAPISGTRIGNRANCTGVTFSAAKTVYMVVSGAALVWTDNIWSNTSSGTASVDFFPLVQDTAAFTNFPATVGISPSALITYLPTVDFSARTLSSTFTASTVADFYGSFTGSSALTTSGTNNMYFSGGTTQTITCAGCTISFPITVYRDNNTVQLGDAFLSTSNIDVLRGTFDTQGYALTATQFFSQSSTDVRFINFRSSTITLTANTNAILFDVFAGVNALTFNAGTSNITFTGRSNLRLGPNNLTFYNFTFANTATTFRNFSVQGFSNGTLVFNNLTFTGPSSGNFLYDLNCNLVVNGTLTVTGTSPIRRLSLVSTVQKTQRTITANAISATDTDFKDILLAGAAAGSSPTRAGDLGGNSGITFPAPKTVYWNLAGTQNWSATAWATSSGGTPNVNNFPLAQDTAVFDNTGAAGAVTLESFFPIGTFDASARTAAMSISVDSVNDVYGNWKFGTGVTHTTTLGSLAFSKYGGTQVITSNGVSFACQIRLSVFLGFNDGYLQLADAFTLINGKALSLGAGTFDANGYNVTLGAISSSSCNIKPGAGTWTMPATGFIWSVTQSSRIDGNINIVFSDTSTASRNFEGGGNYYHKLTIGGTTGTSTTTITGNNTFGELASTKTVAHTIAFGTAVTQFGRWTVTGTVGNVVTITGTGTTNQILGAAVTGVDYLAMGAWGFSTTSPGEFYAGANSTGTAAAPVFRTAAPTPRNLFWVGGTGNWSSTTKWSTSSGGASGADIPTSLDSVTFNSASNATAYTATIDAGVPIARCAAFSMAGPATGSITFAGTVGIVHHGNVLFAATGITHTNSGIIVLSGNGSYTYTTNGKVLPNVQAVSPQGIWSLGSALNLTGTIEVRCGVFSTSASNYAMTISSIDLPVNLGATVNLNASVITITGLSGISITAVRNITFNAGTSTILCSSASAFTGGSRTFYNVSFTSSTATALTITGANVFNNLSITAYASLGVKQVTFYANQSINGTLTLSASSDSVNRTRIASDIFGTQRTLTVNAFAAGSINYDFSDIAITGAAAPISGTRFGNLGGNSGITFDAAKTVFYRQTLSANWAGASPGSWSLTSGGALDQAAFPLAQDTAVFPATFPGSGSTVIISLAQPISTVDMSLRTTNTMIVSTGSSTLPTVYGSWTNGSGISFSGTGRITFSGRGTQLITSAGISFTQEIFIDSRTGTFRLQDPFNTSSTGTTTFESGTLALNGSTFTCSTFSSSNSNNRTISFGGGTIAVTLSVQAATTTNLTVTGPGTIRLTIPVFSTATFNSSGDYSGINLDIGGAGTVSITGTSIFGNISKTSATAATLSLGNTIQKVKGFTASGTAGNLLTITGTSAAAPATLIYTGAGNVAGINFLTLSFLRAGPTNSIWNAGANSTSNNTLGWALSGAAGVYYVSVAEAGSGVDAVSRSGPTYTNSIAEASSGVDTVSSLKVYDRSIAEASSGVDTTSSLRILPSATAETASGIDTSFGRAVFQSAIAEPARGIDTTLGINTFGRAVTEAASGVDSVLGLGAFRGVIAETASGIDTVSSPASNIYGRSVAETSSGIDSTSSLVTFRGFANESASGIDTASSLAVLGSAVTEASSGLDAAFGSAVFPGAVSEAASGIDTTAGFVTFPRAVTESASGIDATSSHVSFLSSNSEAASGIDTASSAPVYPRSVAEASSGVDAASALATFQGSVVESASGIDVTSASPLFSSSTSETASAVDTTASTFLFFGSIAETASGIDATSSVPVYPRAVSETASGVDVASSLVAFGSAVNEASSGVDTTSGSPAYPRTITETASGIDATVGFIAFPSSIAEAASGIDAATGRAILLSSAFEAASGIDATSPSITFGGTVAEASSGIDTTSSVPVYPRSVAEAASGVDATVGFITFPSSITEAASGIDANFGITGISRNIAEAASGIDAISSNPVFLSTVTETSSGVETVSAIELFGSTISEAASGIDTVSSLRTLPGTIAEAASGVDNSFSRIVFVSSASETASGVDSVFGSAVYPSSVTETASGIDAVSTRTIVGSAVVEAVSGIDATSSLVTFGGIVNEAVSGVETATARVIFPSSVTETSSGVESVAGSVTFRGIVSEAGSGADAIVGANQVGTAVSESASGTDVTAIQTVFGGEVTETASGVDAIDALQIINVALAEFVSSLDEFSPAGSTFNAAIAENVGASDLFNARFLWELVEDAQAVNWVLADDSQTVTWSNVNDAQTVTWTNVPVVQTPGWGVIDDSQPPTWQNINT